MARRGWRQRRRRLLKKGGVLPPSSSGSLAYHVLCLQWWSLWSRNSWSNLEISRHNSHILGPDNTPCAMQTEIQDFDFVQKSEIIFCCFKKIILQPKKMFIVQHVNLVFVVAEVIILNWLHLCHKKELQKSLFCFNKNTKQGCKFLNIMNMYGKVASIFGVLLNKTCY